MSITPTAGNAAPNRSGRCVNAAPTNNPPLLPPPIASFGVDVYLLSINHCAKQNRSLRQRRAHQQPAFAAAANRGLGRRRVLVIDHPLRQTEPVVASTPRPPTIRHCCRRQS